MVVPFVYTEEEMQELKNENKKLKEKYNGLWKIYTSEANELKEENRKLKEELDKFSDAYKRYRDYEKEELAESCYDYARENDKLKEEKKNLKERIKELEERLDNKEKVNEKLREEIGKIVKDGK